MKISFRGLGEHVATFETAQELAAGTVVKISGNGVVSPCEDGEKFAGVVLSCRNGFAAVQVGGYAVIPYSEDAAPSVGFQSLCADAAGGIKTGTGRELLVTDVDTQGKTAGVLL